MHKPAEVPRSRPRYGAFFSRVEPPLQLPVSAAYSADDGRGNRNRLKEARKLLST
jgi:hypothetical protein